MNDSIREIQTKRLETLKICRRDNMARVELTWKNSICSKRRYQPYLLLWKLLENYAP